MPKSCTCHAALCRGENCEEECSRCCPNCFPDGPVRRKRGRPKISTTRTSSSDHDDDPTVIRRRVTLLPSGSYNDELVEDDMIDGAEGIASLSLCSARNLLAFFNLSARVRHLFPGDVARATEDPATTLSEDKWKLVTHAFGRMVNATASKLVPKNPGALIDEWFDTRSKRMNSRIAHQIEKKIVQKLFHFAKVAPRLSVERRTVCAILASTMNKYQINKCGADQFEGSYSIGTTSFGIAKEDAVTLDSGQKLKVTRNSRQNFDHAVVDNAIQFFLSESNVCVLSWGTKTIKLTNDEKVILPSITRKRTRTRIYAAYEQWCLESDAELSSSATLEEALQAREIRRELVLGKSSSFAILKRVTNGQKRSLTAVNYMLGELIYDNFIHVRRIVQLYTAPENHKELLLLADLVSNFLKNQYKSHVVQEDPLNCIHGILYALTRTAQSSCNMSILNCAGCKFAPWFFDKLSMHVTEDNIIRGDVTALDVLAAILECEHKTRLWQGQCVRVANQQRAIDEMVSGMKARCEAGKLVDPVEAVVIMDYKMKYVPQYYRQKSLEHFGKRGISWHGMLVVFFSYDAEAQKATRQQVYCDQIVRGSNTQDGKAVAALLETFLLQLSAELPTIKSVCVQSDNANYYHCKYIILALPYIGMSTGITVERYIHTETCDGKGLIDAHFAMGMRYVDMYIGEGQNAAGPGDVFNALSYDGGMPNSFAQLVQMDRAMLEAREERYADLFSRMKLIARQNEIRFAVNPPEGSSHADMTIPRDDPFIWPGTINMDTWQYSGVGDPKVFTLNPNAGTVAQVGGIVETTPVEDEDDEESDTEAIASEGTHFGRNEETEPEATCAFGAIVVKRKLIGELRHVRERRLSRERRQVNLALRMRRQQGAVNDSESIIGGTVEMEGAQDVSDSDSDDSDDEGNGEAEGETIAPSYPRQRRMIQQAPRKDAIAYAVRRVKEMIMSGDGPEIRDGRVQQNEYLQAGNFDASGLVKYARRGWARRPKFGQSFSTGAQVPEEYRVWIAELFAFEGKDKQHPSWILERLSEQPQFRSRLDLPTEGQVRALVGRFIAARTKAIKNRLQTPDYVQMMKDMKDEYPAKYVGFLEDAVREDPSIAPAAVLQAAVDHFRSTDPEDPFCQDQKENEVTRDIHKKFRGRVSRFKATYRAAIGLGPTRAGGGGPSRGGGAQQQSTATVRSGSGTRSTADIYWNFMVDTIANDFKSSTPTVVWRKLVQKFWPAKTGETMPSDWPDISKFKRAVSNYRNQHKQ